jgi:hypothetical protein
MWHGTDSACRDLKKVSVAKIPSLVRNALGEHTASPFRWAWEQRSWGVTVEEDPLPFRRQSLEPESEQAPNADKMVGQAERLIHHSHSCMSTSPVKECDPTKSKDLVRDGPEGGVRAFLAVAEQALSSGTKSRRLSGSNVDRGANCDFLGPWLSVSTSLQLYGGKASSKERPHFFLATGGTASRRRVT